MLVVIVGGDNCGTAEILSPFEVLTIAVDVVHREPLEHKRLEREPVVRPVTNRIMAASPFASLDRPNDNTRFCLRSMSQLGHWQKSNSALPLSAFPPENEPASRERAARGAEPVAPME
jgi:hypothetical protein